MAVKKSSVEEKVPTENPVSGKGTVIPDWGSKNLKEGTIKAILKQLEIDPEEWEK